MPLAWYSEQEYEVYHFCLNCPYKRFNVDTFVIGNMADIDEGEDLEPCEKCEILGDDRELICDVTDSYSEVRNSIIQCGRRLLFKRYDQRSIRERRG